MKVLLVNTVPLEANGISTFIINSAKVMSKRNINVTISAPNIVNDQLKLVLKDNKISLVEIPNRMYNPINYYFKLKRVMQNNNYDVVHVNGNSTTMAIELLAAKRAKVKLRIAHSHNTTTEHPLINKILRPIFESSVNGKLACNESAGKWLFKDNDFTVIRNGIDLNNYKYETQNRKVVRSELGINDKEILLGHVGEFNFQKNQLFLINLLPELDKKIKLLLIGDGENFNRLKEKSEQLKLADRIVFLGTTNTVQRYLSAIDLFLLPSNFEGQPFVIIEASANGLKCLVSKNVSKEVNLCNNVKFLDLKRFNWIKEINQYKRDNRSTQSNKNINILKEKGYSSADNAQKLLNFYERLLK